MSFPSSHVSFERLTDLVEGRLSADEQSSLHSHLATCSRCAANLAWLKRVITLMRTDDSEDAPPAVIARAVRLFQSRPGPAAGAPDLRRRVLALLRFDSRLPRLVLGLRAGPAEAHQQLYSAGPYDLDLRLNPTGGAWIVSGQLLGPEVSGHVELCSRAIQVQAVLNELSEFVLPPVPAGHYSLVLRLTGAEVEITNLEVG